MPKRIEPLLSTSAEALLERFGAGGNQPGAGSAAALAGILAAKLILTVAALTRDKKGYGSAFSRLALIESQIGDRLEVSLLDAFQRDGEAFDQVIQVRRQRDKESDPRRRQDLEAAERAHLEVATEIPLGICRDCLRLAEVGLEAFDIGYRAAQGEAGTAVSLALGGASGALCVVYLNLRKLPPSDWALGMRREADGIARSLPRLQEELLRKSSAVSPDRRQE